MARRWCLLHGLGATGAVWHPVAQRLQARGDDVFLPDLAGHGRAAPLEHYTVAGLADALRASAIPMMDTVLVGHSLGGYVALALADARGGAAPLGVLMLGTKLAFSDEERARGRDLAGRPARAFATHAEALERYRKVAGLDRSISSDVAVLDRGVLLSDAGWQLSMDPGVNAIVVTPMAELLEHVRCPVAAACGAEDPMVTVEALRALVPTAQGFPALGHNAQVEDPDRILAWMDQFVAGLTPLS